MAMVFCRNCGRQIDETAATCPFCGAVQSVVMHVGSADGVPEGVKGWSWGAFLLSWVWAIGNRTWIGLLALVPWLGFIMAVILGFKGREWAWKNKRWDSLEHFNRVQRKWSIWGFIVFIIIVILGFVAGTTTFDFFYDVERPVQVEDQQSA
jgi:zinc-ribbon domain